MECPKCEWPVGADEALCGNCGAGLSPQVPEQQAPAAAEYDTASEEQGPQVEQTDVEPGVSAQKESLSEPPPKTLEPMLVTGPVGFEWDAAASVLLAGHGGGLVLRVLRGEGDIEAMTLSATMPDTGATRQKQVPVPAKSEPVEVSLNVNLDSDFTGINQGVPIYVSILSGGVEQWLSGEVTIDIYPVDAPPQSIAENLTIRLGDQHVSSDRAGDSTATSHLHLFDNLDLSRNSTMDLLKELKARPPEWRMLQLRPCAPPSLDDVTAEEPLPPGEAGELAGMFREVQAAKRKRTSPPAAVRAASGLTCGNCRQPVKPTWILCPYCENPLKSDKAQPCKTCGAAMQPGWKACPACGNAV